VEGGAKSSILWMKMNAGWLEYAMTKFLNLIRQAEIFLVLPIMIDSSKWGYYQAGLKLCKEKSVVIQFRWKEKVCHRSNSDHGAAAMYHGDEVDRLMSIIGEILPRVRMIFSKQSGFLTGYYFRFIYFHYDWNRHFKMLWIS
jgi:hypothetical protein